METGSTKSIIVPLELVPSVEGMIAAHRTGGSRTLDYSNLAKAPSKRWIHLPLAIGLWTLTGLFTFLMLVVVPKFEEIFKDFGVKLPMATVVLLNVSRAMGSILTLAALWVVAVAIPIGVARLQKPVAERRWIVATLTTVFLTVAMVMLTWMLLMLPMMALIQAVSGPTPRR